MNGGNFLPKSGYFRYESSEPKERRNRDTERVHPDRNNNPEII
jgi:hypothetical protein